MQWIEEEQEVETWTVNPEVPASTLSKEDKEPAIDSSAEKMVHIVTLAEQESALSETLNQIGVSGYMLCDVRVDKCYSLEDEQLRGQKSIMFRVVVPKDMFGYLLKQLNQYIENGNQLIVISSDVEVMIPSNLG
ncbi:hypothetical protein P8629_03185 [Hydrogenovibrio sp. 3SP14C1]|uniref:hypothetical protein n=1 Tax=Hydrogenovibrio sp. 3SP14C1 TaxID=3038774 RepID=UPI002416F91E|nr:hypothetical protein [Hydrogenovibrio sp. 3SP14C1]MDG4812003.1 hypothetical protein [Hydrogenovibrio sp. 3SP14C1]